MLKINISFEFKGAKFSFNESIEKGQKFVFDIGEQIFADKLFHVLIGLDKDFSGTIDCAAVDFSHSKTNNVLALGDRTMFVGGSVKKNIYKALRGRVSRKVAAGQTAEAIEKYALAGLADKLVKSLSDRQLLQVALARAQFREPKLIVINRCGSYIKETDEIHLPSGENRYIVEII